MISHSMILSCSSKAWSSVIFKKTNIKKLSLRTILEYEHHGIDYIISKDMSISIRSLRASDDTRTLGN